MLINARSGQQAAHGSRSSPESRADLTLNRKRVVVARDFYKNLGLEYHAVTEQPLSSTFDIAPMWKMYMEPFEFWKKNYENFLKSAPLGADGIDGKKAEVESITSSNDAAMLDWRKSGEEIFKRFAQNQMELWQFISGRWEQYLNLPGQISQCRSLTELGELQSAFLTKFASDYMQETEKLAKPVADLARQVATLIPPHR